MLKGPIVEGRIVLGDCGLTDTPGESQASFRRKIVVQSRDSRLKKLTAEVQKNLPGQASGHVLFKKLDRSPWSVLWSTSGEKLEGKADLGRLTGACDKRQRTVVIYEAESDPLVRSVATRNFQSALCAPVLDETKHLIGLLLLESNVPRAFEPGDRFKWEQLARELGRVLPEYRISVDAQVTRRASKYDFLFNKTFAMIFALVAVMGLFWLLAPSPDKPAPLPAAQTRNDPQPVKEAAERFLQGLQTEDYEKAWTLLDPDLKRRWPSAEFVNLMRDKGQSLQKRSLSRVQRTGEKAVVYLFPPPQGSDKWTWTLRQTNQGWCVTELRGGPVESPIQP